MPKSPDSNDTTGDAFAHLTPLVYKELRRLGRSYMQRERKGHTLQPTALVNEALSRLARTSLSEANQYGPIKYSDPQHFFAVCARQMRHVLVDYAKARGRLKRQSSEPVEAGNEAGPTTDGGFDMIELDQVLRQLEQIDAAAALAFELYYFGGHSTPAIGKLTQVSEATAGRQLRFARAWLLRQLQLADPAASTAS